MCKKNQKYCPSLVIMLRTVCDMRNKDICDLLNISSSAVGNIISRHGFADYVRYRNVDKDAIEAEYLAGASTYELGDKYGVHHGTISKWMKQRGHVRGKGYIGNSSGRNKGHETEINRAIERCKAKTLELTNGNIELVEYYDKNKGRYLCHTCGTEFYRCNKFNHGIRCPECFAVEFEKQKEKLKAEREKEAERKAKRKAELRKAEYKKEKICPVCGSVFHSEVKEKLYCSDRCSRRANDKRNNSGNHRKRARIHGVPYEPGITLKKLIKRDNNICQICGEPCDANDTRYGNSGPLYPSIDHIIAMANGGGHTWDNVQLAHHICNSKKRNLTEEELTEEVIAHAKIQAAAYKCA